MVHVLVELRHHNVSEHSMIVPTIELNIPTHGWYVDIHHFSLLLQSELGLWFTTDPNHMQYVYYCYCYQSLLNIQFGINYITNASLEFI